MEAKTSWKQSKQWSDSRSKLQYNNNASYQKSGISFIF